MRIALTKVEAGGTQSPAPATAPDAGQTVRVWDPFVRVFHWSPVITFVVAWATGDELQSVHETTGYVIVGLLVSRILWGLVGSTHARFSDFVYRPSAVISYLVDMGRLRARRYLGHNPAGGAMVLALLIMLAATCTTGIMMTTAPFWGAEWVEELHELAANLTVLLVGVHLAGVAFASLEHRENLVKAMISGRKRRD
jgi:cytochrome b